MKPAYITIKLICCLVFLSFLFSRSQGYAQTYPQQNRTITLSVYPDSVLHTIDKKIYGYLLEHIYHSINGGLWGELVASRSFEPINYQGWQLENNTFVSAGTRNNSLNIGDSEWTDYNLSLETQWRSYFVGVPAPWSGGGSDVRIVFRGKSTSDSYALHIDALAQNPFSLEKNIRNGKGVFIWQVLQNKTAPNPSFLSERKWHKVNIQCKGEHLIIKWDGLQLMDYIDRTPITKGAIGFLMTQTTGCFRNIKVTSLKGKILWSGIPEKLMPPSLAPDWKSFGEGSFQVTDQNPKNRFFCQFIAPAGSSEAGVMQTPFDLKSGEIYRGSVWARGNGKSRLMIRLRDGDRMLAEKNLGLLSVSWKEYNFTLFPNETVRNGSLQLGISGGVAWIDQASLMADSAKKIGGYRPDLFKAVSQISPTLLRWPGGSFAAGYNWKWGIGPQVNRIRIPKQGWDDYEQNAFGTDEFIDLCRRLNAEPVIVIPIGYNRPENDRKKLIHEAMEWMEYCNGPATSTWGKLRAKNGHPEPYDVKYWEIDNEMWEMGVHKYTEVLKQFVPALKKIDSSIKIIACGDFTEKGKYMDSVLLNNAGKYIDYLSLHHYESPGNFAKGPLQSAKKYADAALLISKSSNPAIKLFISEWNASELDGRTGLYAGGILNVFEREPAISMASEALFLRRTDATSWNNAFINFDVHGYFTAPNYIVTKLWRDHFAPYLIKMEGNTDILNIVATKAEDGKQIILKAVNPSNEDISLKISLPDKYAMKSSQFQEVAFKSLQDKNTMEDPKRIESVLVDTRQLNNRIMITIKKWSAGVITIQLN